MMKRIPAFLKNKYLLSIIVLLVWLTFFDKNNFISQYEYQQELNKLEAEAANWIKNNGNKKPVVGFIVGQTAPPGRRMGHAGAIIGGADDTAAAKMKIMRECGITVCDSPADIGITMAKILAK